VFSTPARDAGRSFWYSDAENSDCCACCFAGCQAADDLMVAFAVLGRATVAAVAVTRSDASGAGVGACLSEMPVADAGRTLIVVPPGAAARRNCGGAKAAISASRSSLSARSSCNTVPSVSVAVTDALACAGPAGAAPIRSEANEAVSESRLNAAMAAVSGVAPRCIERGVAAALRADWALARSDADRMEALDADAARRGVRWCDDSGLDDTEARRDAVDDDELRSEPVDDEAASDVASGSRNPLSCKRAG
jgi:hypothetical protein